MLQCASECKFLLMMMEITAMNEASAARYPGSGAPLVRSSI
jgi:hypothetical protein